MYIYIVQRNIRKHTKDEDTCSFIQNKKKHFISLHYKTSFHSKKTHTQKLIIRIRENKLAKTLHRKMIWKFFLSLSI
jgi:hypothetical protein